MILDGFIKKGKKTGYYLDTAENRMKGQVGKRYTIEVIDKNKKSAIQQQLDLARAKEDLYSQTETQANKTIDRFKDELTSREERDKEWLKNHEPGDRRGDWRINDARIRADELAEEAEELKQHQDLVLDTDEQKQLYVEEINKKKEERSKFIAHLVDKIKLDPKNDNFLEELDWNRTKDLEIIRDFNQEARKNGITQLIPSRLITESNKPNLAWNKEDKYSYLENNGIEVNYNRLDRNTFKDHKGTEELWGEGDYTYPLRLNYMGAEETIDFKSDNINDYLSRLPIVESTDMEGFFERPYDFLIDNGYANLINNPDERFGGIIISFDKEDFLFLKKKERFGIADPNKKKTYMTTLQRIKIMSLKNPIAALNYKTAISELEPIEIPTVGFTEDDEQRQLKKRIKKYNILSIEKEIAEIESSDTYTQEGYFKDEEELDLLYYQRMKYYEIKRELDKFNISNNE